MSSPDRWQLLPPLSSIEYATLKASIQTYGILTPVTVDADTGELLDGHHRSRIAEELGIELPEPHRHRCASDAERAAYAIAVNIERRQLSPEQVRHIREEQRRIYIELRRERKTQTEAAQAVGVPRETGRDWEGSNGGSANASPFPDLRQAIPKDHRQEIAERAESGESHAVIAADYHVTRRRIGQIIDQVLASQWRPDAATTPDMPDDVYRCIVIDPPWPMPKIEREERPNQGAVIDYPTMTLEQIQDLPIDELIHPSGCHVYLWTTHKFLPTALNLIDTWGGRYECLMTWVKNVGITPFSWMYDTEHVLFARFGQSLDLSRKGLRLSMTAPTQGHSVKPDVFYERVLAASPGPRLEMFARRPRSGFDVWGNEVVDADVV